MALYGNILDIQSRRGWTFLLTYLLTYGAGLAPSEPEFRSCCYPHESSVASGRTSAAKIAPLHQKVSTFHVGIRPSFRNDGLRDVKRRRMYRLHFPRVWRTSDSKLVDVNLRLFLSLFLSHLVVCLRDE